MNGPLIYGEGQEYLGKMCSLRGDPGKSVRDQQQLHCRWRERSL